MLDAETLRALVHYDEATGIFTWRARPRSFFTTPNQWNNWNGRYPGTVAGRVDAKGYRSIAVLGTLHRASRLAWLYATGAWPEHQIDHINGVRDDNRLSNLRDVPGAVNARNRRLQKSSVTGCAGVTPYPYQGRMKYAARIRVDGALLHLGYFPTIVEAAHARALAEQQHGFHPNHGSTPPSITRLRQVAPAHGAG